MRQRGESREWGSCFPISHLLVEGGGGDSGHGTSTVFCALVPSQFEAVCSRPPGHILCTSRLSTTKWQGFPGRYCCVPFFLLWRTETLHCLLQLLNKERCPAHHLFLCASRPRSNLPTYLPIYNTNPSLFTNRHNKTPFWKHSFMVYHHLLSGQPPSINVSSCLATVFHEQDCIISSGAWATTDNDV